MTLDEIRELCRASRFDDWHRETGPPFAYMGPGAEDYHHSWASYRPDISVGMAWGLDRVSHFNESWHEHLPDSGASSRYVDLLYNGAPVDRHVYVSIDGGRAAVPLPARASDGAGGEHLTITRWQYDFFKLLDELSGTREFDHYIERVKFEIVD